MTNTSPKIWWALLLTIAALGAWYSLEHYWQARRSYDAAQQEVTQAQSLAHQIAILRNKPDRAAAQSRSEKSLAERIEKAAADAGVAREQLARIEPQQPRRAGDSDYLEHATVIQIDGVTLVQLATTLSKLRGGDGGQEPLRVSNLRISAPYQASQVAGTESWNVELTLTYYVYSAKSSGPRSS